MPPVPSAAQFMPASEHPADLAQAQRLQALWIERQSQTNAVHWSEIVELKQSGAEEKRDRVTRDELLLTTVQTIQRKVDEIAYGSRLAVIIGRALFAIAGLIVAAKAAGLIK
jgi:hypothetical protein